MRVEFVGIARTADASETVTEIGAAVQPDYLYRIARAHERAGFDRALVGSYEQVAESLLGYVAAGASSLLIRGYDPLADATADGNLIRLVHDQVADDVDGYRARVAA